MVWKSSPLRGHRAGPSFSDAPYGPRWWMPARRRFPAPSWWHSLTQTRALPTGRRGRPMLTGTPAAAASSGSGRSTASRWRPPGRRSRRSFRGSAARALAGWPSREATLAAHASSIFRMRRGSRRSPRQLPRSPQSSPLSVGLAPQEVRPRHRPAPLPRRSRRSAVAPPLRRSRPRHRPSPPPRRSRLCCRPSPPPRQSPPALPRWASASRWAS
mmetsp:Transcript_139003/g.432447  ORF Transcript_139003/g.432447 Transcript_139003/m.432447 type:complete len:214 (-) Transcript_139003:1034-1675(-)